MDTERGAPCAAAGDFVQRVGGGGLLGVLLDLFARSLDVLADAAHGVAARQDERQSGEEYSEEG